MADIRAMKERLRQQQGDARQQREKEQTDAAERAREEAEERERAERKRRGRNTRAEQLQQLQQQQQQAAKRPRSEAAADMEGALPAPLRDKNDPPELLENPFASRAPLGGGDSRCRRP
eukprot:gene42361-46713_t